MHTSKTRTACPLDCYDACEIEIVSQKMKALQEGHTQGFLCPHLNHFEQNARVSVPRYKGKEVSMSEALNILKNMLDENLKSETLHYRGSGNFGLMQEVTDHFFAQVGATLTDGSLCDGAGEAGIIEGRGSNKNMPIEQIAKSEVVIFWGRNPHTTSSHLLPLIKDKTTIVIDPVRTKIAKEADLFIQIKPHTDMYLAMMLTRFLHINDACDDEFLEEYASEFEEYYELTQTIRIKFMLENMGVSLGEIGKIIELVREKRVAIVCGLGIQKYRDGADVLRSIDAFATALGLFAKEGCGVAYLGDSKAEISSPFVTKAKKVSKVDTHFDEFKTVFIQGANPLAQMPDTQRVKTAIGHTQNVVYFGLYENETSAVADLVIPAKTFLQKNDIRTSYSHNAIINMPQILESTVGISEYDLAKFLCQAYDIELKPEQEYLAHFQSFAQEKNGAYQVKGREEIPYVDGFDTDDKEFLFLEEIEIDRGANKIVLTKNRDKKKKTSDELFLISSKSPKSLNSQFKRETGVYLHSELGYEEGQLITLQSSSGSVSLVVKHNDDLRKDCVLIYSGTEGVNNLTSSVHSYEGKCAVYQENKVRIKQEENR
jgi:anaerobic selenocysteine-containing dehydrogenase